MPEDVRRAADILERRWTVSIIWASHEGAVRFNEFVQSLGAISPSTLAARLRELERPGSSSGRPSKDGRRATSTG